MVSPQAGLEEEDPNIPTKSLRTRLLPRGLKPVAAVAIIATVTSLCAFLYYFANGMTNVYGDGIAHVNIARKVVDSPDHSAWRRYIQIGSPWLPLQTVSMLPMVANDWMWRTGFAGSIVSMTSFVIAALALYLLARIFYRKEVGPWSDALPALSAAIFIFNPSALYLQSTPMSEIVFMAALVVAVYALQRWLLEQTRKRLAIAAVAMTASTLTRYEAWPVVALSILIVALTTQGDLKTKLRNSLLFASLAAIGPVYWLWHNWVIYGNALEFLVGPNSARGIALQNRVNFNWSAIFVGNAGLDLLTMATATAVCSGPFIFLLSSAGFVRSLVVQRKSLLEHSPIILLILPFFFHTFSLYRGEIQIIPLSALGLLNVRYGLPHLLGVALFAPAVVLFFKGGARPRAAVGAGLILVTQYAYLISEGPSQLAIYQEGHRNGVNARPVRERARVAAFLIANPPSKLVLMHTGALGPVVSQSGLRFSDIIHEGTERWHQLGEGIPKDVEAVIVQQRDPLDLLMRDNPILARDLQADFVEQLAVGAIRVYERREH